MITYFQDENKKSGEFNKKLSTIFKSVETFVLIARTSNSVILSVTRNGLIVILISTGIAYAMKFSS